MVHPWRQENGLDRDVSGLCVSLVVPSLKDQQVNSVQQSNKGPPGSQVVVHQNAPRYPDHAKENDPDR
jgi:hypothetical protein